MTPAAVSGHSRTMRNRSRGEKLTPWMDVQGERTGFHGAVEPQDGLSSKTGDQFPEPASPLLSSGLTK